MPAVAPCGQSYKPQTFSALGWAEYAIKLVTRVLVKREAHALKVAPQMLIGAPPFHIARIQCVCIATQLYRVVDADDFVRFLRGFLGVLSGKAWPAGKDEDGFSVPASVGIRGVST